ncbi:MAG: ABC transporter ATP-binding protein [Candidatus Dormibacterales bacterium]
MSDPTPGDAVWDARGFWVSADGNWVWDGARWRPVLTPDRGYESLDAAAAGLGALFALESSGAEVELRGVYKRFGSTTAVAGIDLSVGPGEVFGLLGPNGAGKTTTLRLLCGMQTPSAGWGRVAGYDLSTEAERAKAVTGYLDEEPIVYPYLSGREFLHLVADLYGVARGPLREQQVQRLFRVLEFEDKADELISSYSHGTRQKVGLASVLLHAPQLLLLDEPTNGLDPRIARTVKDLLKELAAHGRTVIVSTHILEIAEALCDRVAIMDRGRLVAVGTLDQLRASAGSSGASLEELFLRLTGGPNSRALIEQLLAP